MRIRWALVGKNSKNIPQNTSLLYSTELYANLNEPEKNLTDLAEISDLDVPTDFRRDKEKSNKPRAQRTKHAIRWDSVRWKE